VCIENSAGHQFNKKTQNDLSYCPLLPPSSQSSLSVQQTLRLSDIVNKTETEPIHSTKKTTTTRLAFNFQHQRDTKVLYLTSLHLTNHSQIIPVINNKSLVFLPFMKITTSNRNSSCCYRIRSR
jgi:hypothetical protein